MLDFFFLTYFVDICDFFYFIKTNNKYILMDLNHKFQLLYLQFGPMNNFPHFKRIKSLRDNGDLKESINVKHSKGIE